MSSSFTFTGGKELERALAEFAKPMAKAVARRALKKAADPILSAYQAGTTVKSGALQRNEVVGTRLNKRQARMNKKLASKSAVEVHIGTADPGGIQEEFGNRNQSPHPALRPAWDADGGQKAVDRIVSVLGPEIAKTAARVAKKAAKG